MLSAARKKSIYLQYFCEVCVNDNMSLGVLYHVSLALTVPGERNIQNLGSLGNTGSVLSGVQCVRAES